MGSSDTTKPDQPPRSLCVGAASPYALTEAVLGRPIDRSSPSAQRIICEVLQSEYDEMFDMRHGSVLYAGLSLNSKENKAERIKEDEMQFLHEGDLVTPDMSRVQKLGDLEHVGLRDILETRVQNVHYQNGKLKVLLKPHGLGKCLSNSAVTQSMRETMTPYRKQKGEWTPPNCTWENISELSVKVQRKRMMVWGMRMGMGMGMGMDMMNMSPMNMSSMSPQRLYHGMEQEMMQMSMCNSPVQGAIANSWLIAALSAVAWAEPDCICRDNGYLLDSKEREEKRTLTIKLHSKGGESDAPTANVKVNFDVPINNSCNMPIYCRPSNYIGAAWPMLYEKAFAKWLTKSSSDHPDVTQTCASAMGGDPVKAMAQINNGEPQYFFTHSRSGADLIGIVRSNCVNFKTIRPMTAFTHASGNMYKGSNIVANHAYTVLGWAPSEGSTQYIILRNPWGVTEPLGMTTYVGLLEVVDSKVWMPSDMLDRQGVFALEAEAFKQCFACLGMSK